MADINPTELDVVNMQGWYVFDLSQAETNGEVLVFAPVSSTAGVVLDQVQVFTQDAAISSRASQASLDVVDGIVDSILVDTGTDIPASIAALNDLSAEGVRDAVGLAAANLDTQLGKLSTEMDEVEAAILAEIDTSGVGLTAEDIWTYPDRHTTTTVVVDNGTAINNNITIRRGDTFIQPFAGLGSLADCTSIAFMLKSAKRDADGAALIHITYEDGLLTLNGENAETLANGSITITDENAGNILVRMEAAEAAELVPGIGYYDIQVTTVSSVKTPVEGRAKIEEDVNRGVS